MAKCQISRGKATTIPLHRVTLLRPYMQFLSDVGTPIERELHRAGLPIHAIDDVNNYVPSRCFWAFVMNTVHNQGITDLGFRVGMPFGANAIDPNLRDLIRRSPTLYAAVQVASEIATKTIANTRAGLRQSPCGWNTHLYYFPSCGAHSTVTGQIGWYALTSWLGLVRAFTGPQWCPTEIGVMTSQIPSSFISEQLPGTRIRLSQPYTYITLEKQLLSLPPIPSQAAKPGPSPFGYESVPMDLAGSLEHALVSYFGEVRPTIEFASELCNKSSRTLQRRLKESGTCYSKVLNQARFHSASRMLKDRDMNIADIARFLGFINPTHFSRAFRGIAGVSPREYRQQHTNLD